MHRRGFLALVGVAPFAGCLGGMPKDAVVAVEQKSPTDITSEIRFRDLPDAEQAIVRTAMTEGVYHACPELPHAVHSFADRCDGDYPYLTHQDHYYGLYVTITDLSYATTAPPPDNIPDCGLL